MWNKFLYTKCFKESGGTHSHSDTHSLTYSRRKHIRIISLWLDVHLRTENLMEALQYLLSNAGVLVGKRNTSNRIWYQFLQQFEPCICEVIVYETKRSRMDQVKLWKTKPLKILKRKDMFCYITFKYLKSLVSINRLCAWYKLCTRAVLEEITPSYWHTSTVQL